MRLIDADRLLKPGFTDMFDEPVEMSMFSRYAIESQPTVKAIPIETIKKEIERLKEDIKWAWYYGNTAIDKMEYLKMWLEIKLENWEKENEKGN